MYSLRLTHEKVMTCSCWLFRHGAINRSIQIVTVAHITFILYVGKSRLVMVVLKSPLIRQ